MDLALLIVLMMPVVPFWCLTFWHLGKMCLYLCHPKYYLEVLTLWLIGTEPKVVTKSNLSIFPCKLFFYLNTTSILCVSEGDTKMEDDIWSSYSFQTGPVVIWRKYPKIKRKMYKGGQFQVLNKLYSSYLSLMYVVGKAQICQIYAHRQMCMKKNLSKWGMPLRRKDDQFFFFFVDSIVSNITIKKQYLNGPTLFSIKYI